MENNLAFNNQVISLECDIVLAAAALSHYRITTQATRDSSRMHTGGEYEHYQDCYRWAIITINEDGDETNYEYGYVIDSNSGYEEDYMCNQLSNDYSEVPLCIKTQNGYVLLCDKEHKPIFIKVSQAGLGYDDRSGLSNGIFVLGEIEGGYKHIYYAK